MEIILTCISSKGILILFLLVPLMSTGMVNLTQQSKACHGNSNSVFQDNGSTLDTNGKTTYFRIQARRHQAISLLKLLAIIKFQAAGRGTLHSLMDGDFIWWVYEQSIIVRKFGKLLLLIVNLATR
jgi:hypothetical protein